MDPHFIVVEVEELWMLSADVVNEYLRVMRYCHDWDSMREDLTVLLSLKGGNFGCLAGPDPTGRVLPAGTAGLERLIGVVFISKAILPDPYGVLLRTWIQSRKLLRVV